MLKIQNKLVDELISRRAELFKYLYPKANMIIGSITNKEIFNAVLEDIKRNNAKFLIATPPCQAMSSLGKEEYSNDKRNYLIFYVFDIMDNHDFDYILIENVPKYLKLYFPFEKEFLKLEEIVKRKYSSKYNIDAFIL